MRELRVSSLTKQYGDVTALREISFEVERGEFLTVLGPSGSGKTTLLRCIAGVDSPDSGTVEIGSRVVFSKERGIAIPPDRRDVGMVYQSYALWPHMTVFDNVAYPLRVRSQKVDIEKKVTETLDMLGLAEKGKRMPYQLSGGEQQRVALARALVYRPSVLLLDEPFSNLDTPLRQKLGDELRLIQKQTEIATVYVTHHRIEAASMSDRIAIFKQGELSASGSPQELLSHPPNGFVASFLGGLLVLEGVVRVKGAKEAYAETSAGLVPLPVVPSLVEGARIEVYVNPRQSRLAPLDGTPGLRGRVVGVTREVDSLEYHVDVEGQPIRVPQISGSAWHPELQDKVSVVVPPAAVMVNSK